MQSLREFRGTEVGDKQFKFIHCVLKFYMLECKYVVSYW